MYPAKIVKNAERISDGDKDRIELFCGVPGQLAGSILAKTC
jgi:hypothetical protein